MQIVESVRISKADARTIETNYFYDGLNRVINRTYSAPSPLPDNYTATWDVEYYYDGKGLGSVPDYSLGKLTKVANDESETLYSEFDVAGRILKRRRVHRGHLKTEILDGQTVARVIQ